MTGVDDAGVRLIRALGAADCLFAGVLSVRGDKLWTGLAGQPPSNAQSGAIRLLAARHAVQGMALLLRPRRGRRLWSLVSAVHAATMVPIAVVDRSVRRPALVSGTYAAVASALTWPRSDGSR